MPKPKPKVTVEQLYHEGKTLLAMAEDGIKPTPADIRDWGQMMIWAAERLEMRGAK